MVNETGNRNWILEICKFRIWFWLVHCGKIASITCYGFHQILHADQKCGRFYIWCFGNHKLEADIQFYRCADSDFRFFGLWSPHFSTDRHQIPYRVKIKQRWLCTEWYINETGNTSWILRMYKFQFRFRLVHCGTIMSVIRCRLSPNFATLLRCGQLDACCLC